MFKTRVVKALNRQMMLVKIVKVDNMINIQHFWNQNKILNNLLNL